MPWTTMDNTEVDVLLAAFPTAFGGALTRTDAMPDGTDTDLEDGITPNSNRDYPFLTAQGVRVFLTPDDLTNGWKAERRVKEQLGVRGALMNLKAWGTALGAFVTDLDVLTCDTDAYRQIGKMFAALPHMEGIQPFQAHGEILDKKVEFTATIAIATQTDNVVSFTVTPTGVWRFGFVLYGDGSDPVSITADGYTVPAKTYTKTALEQTLTASVYLFGYYGLVASDTQAVVIAATG